MRPLRSVISARCAKISAPAEADRGVGHGTVSAAGPRVHYMRARLSPGDGLPQIAPFTSQDSALLRILTEADALLIRPLGDGPRRAGEMVEYLPI